MKWLIILLAGLALGACGDDRPKFQAPPSSGWAVGAPTAKAIGTSFVIPTNGAVNYITRPTSSLKGKNRITLRYRVDMDEGVRIFPPSMPEGHSIITLYLQRKGDDWTGKGPMNFYRWYATSKSVMPITAGEHEITAHLVDDKWTAIIGSESFLTDPNFGRFPSEFFQEALDKADRIGFVLGGGTGYGHGVRATGPATFTIVEFRVE